MALYNSLNNWLENFSLNEINRDKFIEQFKVEDYLSQRITVFDELDDIVRNNPQEIVDLIRNQIRNNQSLIYLTSALFSRELKEYGNFDSNGLMGKIESISIFWECSNLLKLPAYLISKKRFDINKSKEQKKVLKYFKFLGLSGNENETIRKIRNAHYHPYTFKKGVLINDNGEEVADFETIDLIYDKIGILCNWWILTLLALFYYNPHFSIYVYFAIADEIKSDKTIYKDIIEPIYSLLPKKQEEQVEVEEQPILAIWITKLWRFFKRPIQETKVFFISKIFNKIIDENMPKISKEQVLVLDHNFQIKQFEFGSEMSKLSAKLSSENDIQKMVKLSESIKENALIEVDMDNKHNLKFVDLLERKLNKK